MSEPVYYCVGREAETNLEKYMTAIVAEVEQMISEGYEKGILVPQKVPPREIIIMISTNIIVNLTSKAMRPELDIKKRLELITEMLEHIKDTSLQLWTLIEASQADNKTPH